MRKSVKVLLAVLSVFVVLFFAAGLIVGNLFYELALVIDSDKTVVMEAPANTFVVRIPDKDETQVWMESNPATDHTVTSHDGLQLHAYGYPAPQPSHRWAIACHGYTGNGKQLVTAARRFTMLGFNVLLTEARSHGQSEGNYIGMGWHDRLDLIRWVEEVVEKDPQAEILLYGISMGGATVMMASGEPLPGNVKVIVEDCGYSSVKDEFAYQLKSLFGLPAFPILHFTAGVAAVRAGYTFGEADTVKQVAKSATPMLFIHGSEDTFVPVAMVDKVYEAANVEKAKLIVEGAGHGESAGLDPERYWNAIEEFAFRFIS